MLVERVHSFMHRLGSEDAWQLRGEKSLTFVKMAHEVLAQPKMRAALGFASQQVCKLQVSSQGTVIHTVYLAIKTTEWMF